MLRIRHSSTSHRRDAESILSPGRVGNPRSRALSDWILPVTGLTAVRSWTKGYEWFSIDRSWRCLTDNTRSAHSASTGQGAFAFQSTEAAFADPHLESDLTKPPPYSSLSMSCHFCRSRSCLN